MKTKIKIAVLSILYAVLASIAVYIWFTNTHDIIVIEKWVGSETPDLTSEYSDVLPSSDLEGVSNTMAAVQHLKDELRGEPARLRKINVIVLVIMIAITIVFFIRVQKLREYLNVGVPQPEFSHRKADKDSEKVLAGIPMAPDEDDDNLL